MKRAPVRHLLEYALFLPFAAIVRLVPHRAARRIGRWIGRRAAHMAVFAKRRAIARDNLALAMPEIPPDARERMLDACFEHFGMALADSLAAVRFDLEGLCQRLTLEGWAHLQEAESRARERGTGVIMLSAHLGMWEIAAYPAGIYGGPMHVVGRPLDNPWLERRLVRLRGRFGNVLIPKQGAVRRLMKALARQARVGILIDQRARPTEGIWVPFFGHPAYSVPILARLALRTGAPVVPIFGYPAPEGRYRVVLRPAIWAEEVAGEIAGRENEAAVAALTERYLAVTEAEIRRHPEQWLWMHERWKKVAP